MHAVAALYPQSTLKGTPTSTTTRCTDAKVVEFCTSLDDLYKVSVANDLIGLLWPHVTLIGKVIQLQSVSCSGQGQLKLFLGPKIIS